MKNLKKTLAVVLAFAMILSMGFSAFAYTDVTAGTKVAEAVGILSNLGIFTGFEDGTFKPNDTVTRAQMAAIICRTLGYEDQAQSSAGSTIFNDVPASHWASGYVNVAQSLQIINGYGDGNFGPEDQVTYEQAVKMIVVALGYELDAQAKGGWSTGYLAVASREGITKNANGTVGSAAVRGTIAVLVYNALEVPLMDQDTWTTSGNEDEFKKLQETVLSRYLEITKIEGIVTSVPFGTYAVSGYEADDEATVGFDALSAKYYGFSGKIYKALNFFDADDEVEEGDEITYGADFVPEINEMAGKKVVAYVGNEIDEETGRTMVYAVAEKQGANKVTVLSAAQLTSSTEEGVIEYKEIGSKTKKTLDLANTVPATINFGSETGAADIDATDDLATLAGNGVITLISNNGDAKVDIILITKYAEEVVIESVATEDGIISYTTLDGDDMEEIDTEDEDVLYVVIKDGAIATVNDIAANDTVSIVGGLRGLHESFKVYYVSSKTVTGAVEGYNDDVVEIAGVKYELSALSDYDYTSDLSGKEGIFFLNVDGQIAHDEAVAAKGNYFVVTFVKCDEFGEKFYVEGVLADGTAVTYELSSKAKVYEADGRTLASTETEIPDGDDEDDEPDVLVEYADTDVDVAAYIAEEAINAGNRGVRMTEDNITSKLYEITVKNDKVTKLVELTAGSTADADDEFDAENMEYGNILVNEDTVIVSVVPEEDNTIENDGITIGKPADFFVDNEGGATLSAFDNNGNDIAGIVVGFDLVTTVAKDSDALIISEVMVKPIDGDEAYLVKGIQGGEQVSYTFYDEKTSVDASGLVAGNVILVGVVSNGYVAKYDLLYTEATNSLAVVDGDCEEDEFYYEGALATDPAATKSKFWLDSESEAGADASYNDTDGISMRNAANYTLVDFSEDDEPTVSKKSKGTSLFSRAGEKYDYEVFVRYFEKDQVEVVVYRYAHAE